MLIESIVILTLCMTIISLVGIFVIYFKYKTVFENAEKKIQSNETLIKGIMFGTVPVFMPDNDSNDVPEKNPISG